MQQYVNPTAKPNPCANREIISIRPPKDGKEQQTMELIQPNAAEPESAADDRPAVTITSDGSSLGTQVSINGMPVTHGIKKIVYSHSAEGDGLPTLTLELTHCDYAINTVVHPEISDDLIDLVIVF